MTYDGYVPLEKAGDIIVIEGSTAGPARRKGKWAELLEDDMKPGMGLEVTGITRGQAYALKRAAERLGFRARVLDGGRRVIILRPEGK